MMVREKRVAMTKRMNFFSLCTHACGWTGCQSDLVGRVGYSAVVGA